MLLFSTAAASWGPGPTIAPLTAFEEAQEGRDPLTIGARPDFFVMKKHILDALEVQAPFLVGADRQHFWTNLSLVDVGAGGGEITSYLTHKYGLSARALDIVPPEQNRYSLRRGSAASRPIVPVEVFDGSHLPCEDNSADIVLFDSVLHHAADATTMLLQEAARVSRRWVVVLDDLNIPSNQGVTARNHAHDPHGKFRRLDEWYETFRGTRGVIDVRHDMLCMHMDDTQEPCFSFNTSHRRFYALFVLEVTASVLPHLVSAREEADPRAEKATDTVVPTYRIPPHAKDATSTSGVVAELFAENSTTVQVDSTPSSTASRPQLNVLQPAVGDASLVAKAWAEARAEEHQVGLQEQPRGQVHIGEGTSVQ